MRPMEAGHESVEGYEAPVLQTLGTLEELTLSGGGTFPDQFDSSSVGPPPCEPLPSCLFSN
jgi:hypothetical protein